MQTPKTTPSGRAPDSCVIALREILQSVLGDDFVRLYHYGSRVEGGADAESDYDVLCVTKRPLSRQQRDDILDRQLDLQMDHSVLFDLHFRPEEQISPESSLYSPYIDHVISAGIVV
jgi:predicted nucleotidyltransferase